MSARHPSQPSAFRHLWYYAKDGFRMLVLIFLPLIVFWVSPLGSVEIGDEESSVLAELGPPTGKMLSEGITILTYAKGSVRIRDGVVVGVTGVYDKNKKSVIQDAEGRLLAADGSVEIPLAAPDGLSLDSESLAIRDDRNRAWKVHFGTARELARKNEVPILLAFLDASASSRKMDQMLSDKAFLEQAVASYVLVKVVVNAGSDDQQWEAAQRSKLISSYGVKTFPALVLIASDDTEIGRLPFKPGEAQVYLDLLRVMVEKPVVASGEVALKSEEPVSVVSGSTVTSNAPKETFELSTRMIVHIAAGILLVVVWRWSKNSPY